MGSENKLRVEFDHLEHGWIRFLLSWNEVEIDESISYVQFDFITNLVRGLNLFAQGMPQEIEGFLEPSLLRLNFLPEDGNTLFRVIIYKHDQINSETPKTLLLECNVPKLELLIAFWRALRRLQGAFSEEEFLQRWGRPFPTREMEILTQFIKTQKTNNDE